MNAILATFLTFLTFLTFPHLRKHEGTEDVSSPSPFLSSLFLTHPLGVRRNEESEETLPTD